MEYNAEAELLNSEPPMVNLWTAFWANFCAFLLNVDFPSPFNCSCEPPIMQFLGAKFIDDWDETDERLLLVVPLVAFLIVVFPADNLEFSR